jgi:hypothetical protein
MKGILHPPSYSSYINGIFIPLRKIALIFTICKPPMKGRVRWQPSNQDQKLPPRKAAAETFFLKINPVVMPKIRFECAPAP